MAHTQSPHPRAFIVPGVYYAEYNIGFVILGFILFDIVHMPCAVQL